MKLTLKSVYIILSIITLLNNSECNQHSKIHRKWRKHLISVEKFACGTPQPRNVPAHEVLGEKIVNSARGIFPPSSVLYRCGRSGYCKQDKKCVAAKVETVKLVFLITTLENLPRYHKVEARNHTMCGCKCRKTTS